MRKLYEERDKPKAEINKISGVLLKKSYSILTLSIWS